MTELTAAKLLMETLKAGDKRLISYAVDLGTRITEAFGSKAAVVREIHASRGMMTVKQAMEETRTYTIRNVDRKAKTLILEHPLRKAIRCSTRSLRRRRLPRTVSKSRWRPTSPRNSR